MKINNLKNHLIIANPSINDPIFKKSVILICDYDTEGSMGLIINKPINNYLLNNIILDSDLENLSIDSKIHLGGPIGLDVGFVIHDSNYATEKTHIISECLSLTSDKKIIADIKNKKGPKQYIFTLGYAGWDGSQLDNEIKSGDWLIEKATSNFIFNTKHSEKWRLSSENMGIDLNELSNQSGLA